jgi:short-subunit dehydrogenase
MYKKILIFGASSSLAHQTAIHFTESETHLFLAGRDEQKLQAISDDLTTRNSQIKTTIYPIDALDFDSHQKLFSDAGSEMNGIDLVLIAHGTLPNQENIKDNTAEILKEYQINCTSVISLSTHATNYFEKQNHGTLAVIASVAGDRGRASNYIYGSAKGAVSLYLQGLRNRLFKTGIKIITIKPGMVRTPMTAQMPDSPLFSKAEAVGKGIYKAIISGKDVAYVPGYWKLIMAIIKSIPESIFKKLSL